MPASLSRYQRSLLLTPTQIRRVLHGSTLHKHFSIHKTGIIMTTEITIFEPQNVGTIAKVAPQAFKENSVSHDRCLQFGQELLNRVNTEGMSDKLDQEIATFIER